MHTNEYNKPDPLGMSNSTVQRWFTTAPGAPTTHWYQIRCVLTQPIHVMAGQELTGRLHLVAHSAQSYTINLTLSGQFCLLASLLSDTYQFLSYFVSNLLFFQTAKMWGPGANQGGILQSSSCKFDLKEPYYRMSQPSCTRTTSTTASKVGYFFVRQVGYDHCCVIIWSIIISMSEILLKEYVMNAEAEVDLSIITCVYISRCRTYIY